eukprot:COSAG01_NODE_48993_length_376_cov_0.563177_1_plen_57_part_10
MLPIAAIPAFLEGKLRALHSKGADSEHVRTTLLILHDIKQILHVSFASDELSEMAQL